MSCAATVIKIFMGRGYKSPSLILERIVNQDGVLAFRAC